MKKVTVKLLLFVFCFLPDVRVKAEANFLMTEPKNCLQQPGINCAVASLSQSSQNINIGDMAQVYFAGDTIFIRNTNSQLELVSGIIYVKANKKFTVTTVYGNIELDNSEALIEVTKERVEVVSLLGENKLFPADKREELKLPGGYQNYMAAMNIQAISEVGFPHGVHYKPTIEKWAKLFPGNSKKFKAKLQKVRPIWAQAVEHISHLQPKLIERRIAEIKKQKEQERFAKLKRKRESQRLRKLFYQKTFNP